MNLSNYRQHYWYQNFKEVIKKLLLSKNLAYRPPQYTCWRPFPWCCSEAPWIYNDPNHFDQIEYHISDWRNDSDSFLYLPAGSSPRRSGGEDGCKPGSLNKLLLNCPSRWSVYLSLCWSASFQKRDSCKPGSLNKLIFCERTQWSSDRNVNWLTQHHCGEDDYDVRSQNEDITCYLNHPYIHHPPHHHQQ